MIHAPTETLRAWEEAWLSDYTDKHITLVIMDEFFTYIHDDEIVADSFRLTQSLMDGSEMSLCGCIASTLEIEIYNRGGTYEGKRVSVELSAGGTETITVFDGYVTETSKGSDEETIKLTCYDVLYSLSNVDCTLWYQNQPRQTISQLLTALLSHIGVQRSDVGNLGPNGSLEVDCHELYTEASKKYLPENTTALGILKAICTACGTWGFIDRYGKFGMKNISDLGADTFSLPFYMTANFEGEEVAAPDAVISTNSDSLIHDDADDMSPCVSNNTQNPQNPYVIKGNILTLNYGTARRQPMVDNLYTFINALAYRPFTATIPAIPWYYLGDALYFDQDETVKYKVLKRICTLYEETWSAEGSAEGGSSANLNSSGRASDEQLSSMRGGGGGDASNKMDKVNPTGSGALTISHGTSTADTYVSIGRKTSTVIGTSSLAIGHNASATQQNGIGIGTNVEATSGVSIGNQSKSGTSGVSIGQWNNNQQQVGGSYNVAIGYQNYNAYYDTSWHLGASSVAVGNRNKIGGTNVTAIGSDNLGLNNTCFMLGDHLKTNANNQTILGKYNAPDSTHIFELGNGTGDGTFRKNAVWVTNDGVLHALTDVEANGIKLSEAGGGVTDYYDLTSKPITKLANNSSQWSIDDVHSMFIGGDRPTYSSDGITAGSLAFLNDIKIQALKGSYGFKDDTIVDLDNIKGFYFGRVRSTVAHMPIANDCYLLAYGYDDDYTIQFATRVNQAQTVYFVRKYQQGTWSAWSSIDLSKVETHRFTFTVSGSGSKTITKTVTNDGFRLKVTTLGNRANSDGEWLIYSNNGGTNTASKTVITASDITFDFSVAQQVKITNGNTASVQVVVECGNLPSIYTVS